MDVADDLPADLGLVDPRGNLGRGVRGRAGLTGRTANLSELVAGLLEGEPARPCVHAGRCRDMRDALEFGQHRGEVVLAELPQGLAGPQAHGGKGQDRHLADPVGAPAEPPSHLSDPAHLVVMLHRPGGGQVNAAGLGQQQLQVSTQMASDKAPGDERPGLGAVQISHTLRVGRRIQTARSGW